MPAKLALDKKAWEWALKRSLDEISEEDINTAYRVSLPSCKPGICRKNCSGNPNCLNHLQNFQADSLDDDGDIKAKETFVGLRNLGSTCYVNSLLQVWFHNDRFCSTLFSYNAFPDISAVHSHAVSIGDTSDNEAPKKKLKCDGLIATNAMQHLQLLFTRLQYSQQQYVDPIDFVNSLSLKHNEQQDAQEFRNLFLGWLEKILQGKLNLTSFIRDEFRGTYDYITTCSSCGKSSAVQSDYGELELNVQGMKSITDSLSDFFKEETLTDDNQYYCHHCRGKQNAVRKIKLSTVPRVLNLQLLRFVYDMSLLAKVKVSSHILFPESLDLSSYCCRGSAFKFHLTGVIIHRGPTAYAGHYIAHILDRKNGEWYRFDDEHVSKLNMKHLGEEDDEAMIGLSSKKKPRCPKGSHVSANAYLLVYTRDDDTEHINRVEAPAYLQEVITGENEIFLESLKQTKAEMEASVLKNTESMKAKNDIFSSLSHTSGSEYEWISTNWLVAWLNSTNPGPINNAQFLCEHKLISPESVVKLKRVDSKAVEALYSQYSSTDTIRLSRSMVCRKCVIDKASQLQLKLQLSSDYKRLCSLTKSSSAGEYWVGKKSLRSWRRLYQMNKNADEVIIQEASCEQSAETDDNITAFNEDLLCCHGQLCADANKRRLVSSDAWNILLKYFPSAVSFTKKMLPCPNCLASLNHAVEEHQLTKNCAIRQKEELIELYLNKNRPRLDKIESEVYAVPMSFYEDWCAFIKTPTKNGPPTTLDTTSLLCPHGGFLYDPSLFDNGDFENIVLVWPEEWKSLLQWYTDEDKPVCLLVMTDQDTVQYTSSPECCYQCVSIRLANEHAQAKDFGEADIFVYKCEANDDPALKLMQTSKLSTRRQRVPVGSSKLKVSSTMTLTDLKLEIMNLYAASPNDQHLWLGDVELVDKDKMLMQLDITPRCILVLKVDEVGSDSLMGELIKDIAANNTDVESGFKGTILIN
ncbi:ubiquitin carboxyl-terminal hydrolase 48-like isoform X2 [Dysidea avara]|uniref:ubiquitin carboxyl-terminal hydrolase 48-like isoform X2 n=1 Tax=Dysidea avara TaxID=196820 RepID=UPI003323BD83